MHKAVAKYGLAAHLALLAVAPLFLFSFSGEKTTGVVLLWLCIYATMWLFLSPSLLGGEMLNNARKRVLSSMLRDPAFWTVLAVLAVVALRSVNTGIRLTFDYETAEWTVLSPALPFLPGSTEDVGVFPFAAALSAVIVLLGCRHVLGKSARMMFLLLLSVFSGVAAFVALFLLATGDGTVSMAISTASQVFFSPGIGFALCLLCSVVAIFAALERDWGKSLPLLGVAVAGNTAAAFVFLSSVDVIAFAIAYVFLLVFVGLLSWRVINGVKGLKGMLVLLFSLALACVVVCFTMPADAMEEKLTSLAVLEPKGNESEHDENADDDIISGVASKIWSEHPWTGVGVGAFRFHPRFHLSREELGRLPRCVLTAPNSWLHLLAERGIVGAVLIGLPLVLLLCSYFAGVFRCIRRLSMPGSAVVLAPIALSAVVFTAFHSASLLSIEVLTLSGAILVISAKSFPKENANG